MRNRVRVRRDDWAVSPPMYWRLRRWSPAINFLGMAGGGLLLLRSILVFGVAGDEYVFGPDILIAAAILLCWAAAVLASVGAPSQVVARRGEELVADQRVVVAPFDVRSPLTFIVVVPLVGLLAAMMWAFLVSVIVAPSTASLAEQLVWRAPAVVCALLLVLPVRAVLRSTRHGIELSSTRVFAFGFLRTQRIARTSIVGVEVIDAAWWATFAFFLLRIDGRDSRIRLRLAGASPRPLVGTHAPAANAERGAQLLRAWAGLDAP